MRTLALAVLALTTALSATARAEHAKIQLDVSTDRERATAFVDQTPPDSGKSPRKIIHAKVNEPIKVRYLFENVYPHKVLEDVVIHFFVARQEAIGQKELPVLGDDVLIETAFDMDFAPGAKAGARTTLRVATPGVYLIRVESRQTGSDHEHFAAIDLVVE